MSRDDISFSQHAADSVLIRLADGELPPGEADRVMEHLKGCWTCRGRAEEFNQTILRLLNHRNEALLAAGEPPSAWLGFRGSLRRQALELASKPAGSRTLRARSLLGFALRPGLAMTVSALLVVCGWTFFSTTVSAHDALHQAQINRERALHSLVHPVIHQKLRVRLGSSAAMWDLWWAPQDQRLHQTVQGGSIGLEELNALCRAHDLDARDPISAAAFDTWRTSLRERREDVSEDRERGTVRISTEDPKEAGASGIREATFEIRERDWHPISETIRYRTATGSETEFSVQEVAFEMLVLNAVPAGIFPPETVDNATATALARANRALARDLAEAALAESQIQLLEALHSIGADIRERPEIRRESHRIVLRLCTYESGRKEEVLNAVAGISGVASEVEDAETSEDILTAQTRPAVAPSRLYATRPPLFDALAEYSGSPGDAYNYLSALGDAQASVLSQASALDRLAQAYPDDQWKKLQPEQQHRIDLIAADYIAAIGTAWTDGLQLIDPVLNRMLELNDLDRNVADDLCADPSWRVSAGGLHDRLSSMHQTFRRLFVEDHVNMPLDVNKDEYLAACVRLRAECGRILRSWTGQDGDMTPVPCRR